MHQVELYVDGSCLGNPGPAGIGIVLKCSTHRKEFSQAIGESTNNVAEIKAVIEGVKLLKYPEKTDVVIYTDSQLVEGFIMKGWQAKQHQVLVEYLRVLLNTCNSFSVIKIRGHAGVEENERCHHLAQQAARNINALPASEMVCL